MDKKKDPTIQLIYQVSKEKFENECRVEEEKLEIIEDLCSKAKRQFHKILTCLGEGESTEKIEKYAKDGEEFLHKCAINYTFHYNKNRLWIFAMLGFRKLDRIRYWFISPIAIP